MMKQRGSQIVIGMVVIVCLLGSMSLMAEAGKVLRLPTVLPDGNPSVESMRYFADLVNERSQGELDVQVFPNSQLGGLRDTMEACVMGLMAFTNQNAGAAAAQFIKSLNVTGLPYIFKSRDHMFKVLEGKPGQKLVEDINNGGLVFLAWFDGGSRNIITNKRGVSKPEDLKGLKIRVMPNQQMVKTINLMGGIATPMEQGEVYNALQQGVLDGWENSPVTLLSLKLYEVSEYFSWTSHFRVPDFIAMSRKVYDKLTPEQQEIIVQAGKECQAKQRELWDAYYAKVVEDLKAVDVDFTEVQDLTPFIDAVQPVWDDFRAQYGDDLINMILEVE